MKIAICWSFFFSKEIMDIREHLTTLWHDVLWYEVFLDVLSRVDGTDERYSDIEVERQAMIQHHDSVATSDAILVCNFDKNEIPGYIWWSTLMEIGIAYHLKKKIFILNTLPNDKQLKYIQEIILVQPTIINWDLSKIQ